MILLQRAQMAQGKQVPNPLNITVKSARGLGLQFAPTWSMVTDHKQGKITDEYYTYRYLNLLRARLLTIPNLMKELVEYGQRHQDNVITFLCFCQDGKFCHTYLLIDWLTETYPHLFTKEK